MVKQEKSIQSVERALNILELYKGKHAELSVTEIANELDLNKSTVFGLIKTLLNRGYLHQNESNAKYSLGLKALELGYNVQLNNVLLQKARPYLEILSAKYDETVHLAIEDNGEVLYVDRILGAKTISMNSEVWRRHPIYCTGLGKCLLAFMHEDRRAKILQHTELKPRTKNTITNPDDLRKELELIYRRGYSIDNEEFEFGLICIAVPIIKKEKGIIASISLSTPTLRFDYDNIEKTAQYLKELANKIENTI